MLPSTQPSPADSPKIIAGIPCYNEERFIADVVSRARKYVHQVVVVDDGSTDKTAEIAQAYGAIVVKHGVNRGPGEAIKSCFNFAVEQSADILVTLDGDGQHNPDEIPLLLSPILSGSADIVIGCRLNGGFTNMPRYRKFGIDVITWLLNFGSRAKVIDSQSGYRAYSRKALGMLQISERGFAFSVELLIEARRKGLLIAEAPVSCLYHSQGSTMNAIPHGLGVALAVVRLRLRHLVWAGGDKT